jgi:hypothetical protein
MDFLSPILIIGIALFLIYGVIVLGVMILSRPAVHYRQTKYNDKDIETRWWLIPILLPLRICYGIVMWSARVGKWLLFLGVGTIALLLSPLYFLVFRPLAKFIHAFQEAMGSFEKYVAFFKSSIRLGHWVMFYPEENITPEKPMPKIYRSVKNPVPLLPKAMPDEEDEEDLADV